MKDLTEHFQLMYPLARWAAMSDDQFYCTPWVRREGLGHLAFGFIPVLIIKEVMLREYRNRPATMGDQF